MSLLASGVLANSTTPYFGGGGGGGGGITTNNATLSNPAGASIALTANVPVQIGAVTVNANYGSGLTDLLPVVLTQIVDLQLVSDTIPSPGDRLIFYTDVSTDGNTPTITTPSFVIDPAPARTTTTQIQFNPIGTVGRVSQAAHTYTIRFMGLYGTSNVTPYNVTTNQFGLNSQVLACL